MGRTPGATGSRSRSRALLLQALYQARLAGHDLAELEAQFAERREYSRCDRDYFRESLAEVLSAREALEADVAALADRPLAQLDPVELAVLLIGLNELQRHPDVPYRVVINEAVTLARRYGAEDGHKYVNAVLDRAARRYRRAETGAAADG